MPEKPKRKFIVFFYMNDAWRALTPEEREKEREKINELNHSILFSQCKSIIIKIIILNILL